MRSSWARSTTPPWPSSSRASATPTAVSSERVEAYRDLVGNCLDEAFARLANRRGAFVGVVLETYRGRLERYLQNLVTVEAERFPSLEIKFLEAEFELEYPEVAGGVVLRGRIDRISRSEKGAIVVDYKKGGLPTKAQVAPDADGNIAEAQIPCYLRLVTDGGPIMGAEGPAVGAEIDSAWYISIEGDSNRKPGSAACAFGAPTLRPGFAIWTDDCARRKAIRSARGPRAIPRRLRRGPPQDGRGYFRRCFPLAPKESQKIVCANCGARGICRERYALRFGVIS